VPFSLPGEIMKTLTLVVMLLGILVVTACEDDPIRPSTSSGLVRENLSQRWHVLNNIEYAYKTRRIDIYDELLNANFTFYFSPGDVNGGSPVTFNRAEEKDATGRLFISNEQTQNPPPDPVCRTIRLELVFEPGELIWVEVHPQAFPTETWYATTVFYTFTFEIEPNTTYIAQNGAKAQFVVRNTGTDQNPHWQLVEFRDLGS
jgi:hypothetical protein